MRQSAILLLGLSLSACGQSEPRSTQYFETNLDEARKVVAGCRDGSMRGDECTNADVAVQTVEGRERFKRFLGKD
ncbi:EexN family lipoprotein [Sphingopyxis sp. H050]|uniref:EexN family lipoprotein n=1 Tax=unclassified Sphingopyxis TaxID=2614943 RepID=UPI001E46596E|nr:EexN family lipoprotein [Sphingopyxis sp. H050]